jgi:MipA family protein
VGCRPTGRSETAARRLAKALAIIAALAATRAAAAGEEAGEKWEFGLGMGGLSIADYRGSREYRSYALPLPYLIYRGEFIKADRRGIRGEIVASNQFEFNISMNAAFTPDSEDNSLRRGMPGLDSTFEIGPAFSISLGDGTLEDGWLAYFPVRAVIAFDENSIHQIGAVAQPQLAYRHPFRTGWLFTYNGGIFYGDRDYHDYYYSIAPQYVTPTRPAYQAGAGYSGFSTQLSLTRRHGSNWYGGFVRYDNLGGADFEGSPLVETRHYFVLGIGISRIFNQ